MSGSLLRGLEVFCALIETGSATAAARRLGLSQPAVSQQIARLEGDLALTLFVRENGRMKPTETGLTLYEESRHAFDGLDRVLNLARDIRGLEQGQLRVAAPHSSSATYLPAALARMTEGRPNLRFRIDLGTYERIAGLVAAREADIGIAKAPLLTPGLDSIDLASSGLVAVSAPGGPLADKPGLGPRDLAQVPLIMVGRGRPWRDEIDVAFRRLGVAPRVRVETQSVESACGFAAQGFGTAIVPEWLTWGLARADLHVQRLDIGIAHHFVVIYPARTRRLGLAEDFARACTRVVAEARQRSRAMAEGGAAAGASGARQPAMARDGA